tara:strand:- start:56 stop:295 length:240 start_codon:yes stop_codon:yes gene_type:complete
MLDFTFNIKTSDGALNKDPEVIKWLKSVNIQAEKVFSENEEEVKKFMKNFEEYGTSGIHILYSPKSPKEITLTSDTYAL